MGVLDKATKIVAGIVSTVLLGSLGVACTIGCGIFAWKLVAKAVAYSEYRAGYVILAFINASVILLMGLFLASFFARAMRNVWREE